MKCESVNVKNELTTGFAQLGNYYKLYMFQFKQDAN